MKTPSILNILAVGSLLPLTAIAQVTEKTETVRENADGTVTETTRTVTFTPEVQTKVIEYFQPYSDRTYGLPPEVVEKVQIKKVPAEWRTTRIEPGLVIKEDLRPVLVPAPPKLAAILPDYDDDYGYYIAGGNVVVVDPDYRVVDSIRVPSITIDVD